MPHKVLIYSRFAKAMMVRIGEQFDLMDAGGQPPLEKFGAADLGDVRALITAGGQPLGAGIMDMLPALKAIVCYGTGYDGIDFAAAEVRGIAVANSPAANASAVAELALALMLAATRRIVPADSYLREGGWSGAKASPLLKPPHGLVGRRVGLYGMGEIGRKIATRTTACESEVGYHSRNRHDVPYTYFYDLAALADWCDVLVIAIRAAPDNQRAVNADILKRIGPDGYLINIARGSMIDEPALIAALEARFIAGAGLDVFQTEPHAPGTLSRFPNVVLTPHVGGHTIGAHHAMQDCVIANLGAFFAGKPMPHRVPA